MGTRIFNLTQQNKTIKKGQKSGRFLKDWAQGCASNPAPASDHQKAFSPLFRPEKGLGRVHHAPLGSTKFISAPNLPLKPESLEKKD
ncbi:hypothetical protein [Vibrio aerogenes]|uniref:hypothetical protein n=1 Tax=Vibrio aerogenes TaxID=92172 RepID=UPI001114CD2C|nr:hypothetical protein [Vibrio aerogenes]